MPTVYILQHIHCETPGLISDYLQEAGIGVRFVKTFEGQPVPSEMIDAAGLVIMGGPMSAYDHERLPFLLDEQRLIENALRVEKPILGICLGSQLLAATLGAEVKSGTKKEIGWHRLRLTEAAAEDPLWAGVQAQFTAFHWHGDVFDLPQGTISLASSELTPCQAFRYSDAAYGLLFHMEVTQKILNAMVAEFLEELDAENIASASITQQSENYLPNLQSIGATVFRRWTKLIKPI